MRLSLLLAALAVAAGAVQSAKADALAAVNWARLRGCNSQSSAPSLRSNSTLQRAAVRLASGAGLHEALAAVGYLTAQSSALHMSGVLSDAQVSDALTANYCRTLIDPTLREMGVERRGRELWIVLAAPSAMPAAADPASVGKQVLEFVNRARAAGRRCGGKYFPSVAPLALNVNLAGAARAHSSEMARYAEFSHRGHDGSTPAQRVERAGYGAHRIVGENIAAGAMTPLEVTDGWLSSPAHCENIMDGRFTEIGIGYAVNAGTAAGMYWTQDFAARR